MPYVNIKVTREGVTPQQKRRLIKGATDLLVEVLDKNPQTTFVVIDEVETEDWGIGGLPVMEFRSAHSGNTDRESVRGPVRPRQRGSLRGTQR